MRARVLILFLAVIAMGAALWWSQHRPVQEQISGFIEADDVRVGSRVGGRVARVAVREGQSVTAGDVLVELDPYDLTHRRAQAAAKLDERKAELEKLKNGPRPQEIGAAEARLAQAQADVDVTVATEKRLQQSFEQKATSADEMERAVGAAKAAVATAQVRQQELALLRAGTRVEDITAAQAAMQASAAEVAALDQQLAELTVKAPLAGVVQAIELRPGDLVPANAPMLSITDTSRLWVRAYLPEDKLHMQPDQKVEITVDSFRGQRFGAHISFVSSQAEFTPNNVQTPEERSKQVFRVHAELDEGLDVLRAGMAADVWLLQ